MSEYEQIRQKWQENIKGIQINEQLQIVGDPRGALIMYLGQTEVGNRNYIDCFQIGIKTQNIIQCLAALTKDPIRWWTKDRSLLISGSTNQITLEFYSDEVIYRSTLESEEIDKFKQALLGFAEK